MKVHVYETTTMHVVEVDTRDRALAVREALSRVKAGETRREQPDAALVATTPADASTGAAVPTEIIRTFPTLPEDVRLAILKDFHVEPPDNPYLKSRCLTDLLRAAISTGRIHELQRAIREHAED